MTNPRNATSGCECDDEEACARADFDDASRSTTKDSLADLLAHRMYFCYRSDRVREGITDELIGRGMATDLDQKRTHEGELCFPSGCGTCRSIAWATRSRGLLIGLTWSLSFAP